MGNGMVQLTISAALIVLCITVKWRGYHGPLGMSISWESRLPCFANEDLGFYFTCCRIFVLSPNKVLFKVRLAFINVYISMLLISILYNFNCTCRLLANGRNKFLCFVDHNGKCCPRTSHLQSILDTNEWNCFTSTLSSLATAIIDFFHHALNG